MGNAETMLSCSEYVFENPTYDWMDMRTKSVYIIDSREKAEEAKSVLETCATIYVDCEGHYFGNPDSKIGLVQVATDSEHCFIFDVITYEGNYNVLKQILENRRIKKVFHDCSGDIAALLRQAILIDSYTVEDVQLLQKCINKQRTGRFDRSNPGLRLEDLYESVVGIPLKRRHANSFYPNKWIAKRPLSEDMVKYASVDVLILPDIFRRQEHGLESRENSFYREEVRKRIQEKFYVKSEIISQTSNPGSSRGQETVTASSNLGRVIGGAVLALALGAAALMSSTSRQTKK